MSAQPVWRAGPALPAPGLPTPTPTPAPALQTCGVRVRAGRAVLLDRVDITVPVGSWTCIVGPNGAGKSTLLRAFAALVKHEGEIDVHGRPLAAMTPRERARCLGYAPQNPVIPAITVGEYVMLGRTPYRSLLAPARDADVHVVEQSLRDLDLAHLAPRQLASLSGGEKQRAVLARAIAQQSRILLLDEPTAALDLGHAQAVLELVDRLRREHGLTVLSTLHDLALAGQYADALVLLSGGRVVVSGPAQVVLTPGHLAEHYGALAQVSSGPDGVRVHPVRPSAPARGQARAEPAPLGDES
ncbi:MAG TPA: ABC transporter ATP-binding protein [Candidatus Lustribacter sp.]|nr:ABC transporter ATP-binding protein [Candidatus Lustribacter sp.]